MSSGARRVTRPVAATRRGRRSTTTAASWRIDNGSQPYVLLGTKWGAGSPYTGGTNVVGPRIAGGVVTYSFMGNGVDLSADGGGANLAISSLPTYQP